MNGEREKARNVWRFGVMRFNYKTRRVLQLARRRTPHPRPSPSRGRPARLAPFPFRRSAVIYGLIRLIFPPTPNSAVLSLSFLASARKLTPSAAPSHVKDSRTERPRTPASRCLPQRARRSRGGSIFHRFELREPPNLACLPTFLPFLPYA